MTRVDITAHSQPPDRVLPARVCRRCGTPFVPDEVEHHHLCPSCAPTATPPPSWRSIGDAIGGDLAERLADMVRP